jgi:hypothetical protein
VIQAIGTELMTEDYCGNFPPARFPGRQDHVEFVEGTLLDHPMYVENHPVRKQQIDDAAKLLRAFDEGRVDREAKLRRMLKSGHRDNSVLAMTLNSGFIELLRNWAESCRRHDIEVRDWTMIAALDEKTAETCDKLGFTVFFTGRDYGQHSSEAVGHYGDADFRNLMFPKNAVVQDLLNLGYDVLFQDVDMVWLKDPFPFLNAPERKMLDAQFMYDGPHALYAPLHANSGFFYLRNTDRTRAFWQVVHRNFDKVYHYAGQQRVVNIALVHHYFQGLKLDMLRESDFANGHLFTWDDVSGLPPDPFVIHNSWTSNIEHKMKKYHLAGLWYL